MTNTDIPLPTVVFQNRPSVHRRAVYLCADEKFIPYSLFVANQIATAHPARDFDICIVSASPIAPHPLFDTLGIRVVQIDALAVEQHLHFDDRIGFAAYLRIFMPQIWSVDYDRLLYLDGDIFYQRGDISALLSQPLLGLAVAAVRDCDFWERPDHHAKDIRALGLPALPYFNSGILLIDVQTFLGQGYFAAIMQLIFFRGKELLHNDQTALNVVMANNWAQLPLQWNFQYHYKTMLWSSQIDVCLFHFVGRRKPFYAMYGANARRFTSPYRQFMTAHFPDHVAQIHDGLGGPVRWWWMLLVVFFNLKKMQGILLMEAQTDGDFDIRPIAKMSTRQSPQLPNFRQRLFKAR